MQEPNRPMAPGFYEVKPAGAGVCIRRLVGEETPPALQAEIERLRERAPAPGVYWIDPREDGQSMYRLLASPDDEDGQSMCRLLASPDDLPKLHEQGWQASVLERCTTAVTRQLEKARQFGLTASPSSLALVVLEALTEYAKGGKHAD